jgi:hypothetical protein
MLAPAVLDPSHLFQHLGYGLGGSVKRLRRAVGLKEDVALAGVAFIAMAWARDRRAARPARRCDEHDIVGEHTRRAGTDAELQRRLHRGAASLQGRRGAVGSCATAWPFSPENASIYPITVP